MAIIDLYSKRKKATDRNNQPEVYQYTDFPIQFRRQVIYVWSRAIGVYQKIDRYVDPPILNILWQRIYELLDENLDMNLWDETINLKLELNGLDSNPFEKCKYFLLNEFTNVDDLISVIEFTFRLMEQNIPLIVKDSARFKFKVSQTADSAINELNCRFLEHGIGYQYNNGKIIRIDSGFIHAEAVIPALTLIAEEGFIGAEQEFRSAHEHYRNQEYKAAIVDAQKAFESTMKTICEKFGWDCNHEGDTAAILINTVLNNELIPRYLQSHLSGLKKVLASGVPTVRNKEAGHGQGSEPVNVPEYLAAYVLHLTASNIVLLVEAYKAKRSEVK